MWGRCCLVRRHHPHLVHGADGRDRLQPRVDHALRVRAARLRGRANTGILSATYIGINPRQLAP